MVVVDTLRASAASTTAGIVERRDLSPTNSNACVTIGLPLSNGDSASSKKRSTLKSEIDNKLYATLWMSFGEFGWWIVSGLCSYSGRRAGSSFFQAFRSTSLQYSGRVSGGSTSV